MSGAAVCAPTLRCCRGIVEHVLLTFATLTFVAVMALVRLTPHRREISHPCSLAGVVPSLPNKRQNYCQMNAI